MPLFSKEVLTWFTISSAVVITALGIVVGGGVYKPEPKLDIVDYTFEKFHYAADTIFDVTVKNTGGTTMYNVEVILYGLELEEMPPIINRNALRYYYCEDTDGAAGHDICNLHLGVQDTNTYNTNKVDLDPGESYIFTPIDDSIIPGSSQEYMKIGESYSVQIIGYGEDQGTAGKTGNEPDVYFTKSLKISRGQ